MVENFDGDILRSNCNIICQQVNTLGIMGGGLAAQIAKKYPECNRQYIEYCNSHSEEKLLNSILWYQIDYNHFIANIFSQRNIRQPIYVANPVYVKKELQLPLTEFKLTDYSYLKKCLKEVHNKALEDKLTVGIPYKYGCGIAIGNWNNVNRIINDTFNDDVMCQIWKL